LVPLVTAVGLYIVMSTWKGWAAAALTQDSRRDAIDLPSLEAVSLCSRPSSSAWTEPLLLTAEVAASAPTTRQLHNLVINKVLHRRGE
jgi:K+ transporter